MYHILAAAAQPVGPKRHVHAATLTTPASDPRHCHYFHEAVQRWPVQTPAQMHAVFCNLQSVTCRMPLKQQEQRVIKPTSFL